MQLIPTKLNSLVTKQAIIKTKIHKYDKQCTAVMACAGRGLTYI